MTTAKKIHPAAERLPMMSSERLAELVESIKKHGLRDPIVRCDGGILDGRNRMRACEIAGVEPVFREYGDRESDGSNPFYFVLDTNLERRDVDAAQREAIKILLERDGDKFAHVNGKPNRKEWIAAEKERETNKKRSDAARAQSRENNKFGAGPRHMADTRSEVAENQGTEENRTRQRMHAVERHSPELLEKVARGEVKGMQAVREVKRATLAGRVAALPADKHRVIYADPPWKYGDEREGLEKEGTAAAAQYPTMPTTDICALDIKSITAPDAVLFMWATFPLLEDALEVIKAWGFKYKTAIVWDKQRSNVGNYHDARAELLMIATRGSCPIEIDTRPKQVQSIARGKHSAKPEEFRALIDQMYPTGPRIELFRRGDMPKGWKAWGNEAEVAA